jgi:hypothetical protein
VEDFMRDKDLNMGSCIDEMIAPWRVIRCMSLLVDISNRLVVDCVYLVIIWPMSVSSIPKQMMGKQMMGGTNLDSTLVAPREHRPD